jgi:hypothetical protein
VKSGRSKISRESQKLKARSSRLEVKVDLESWGRKIRVLFQDLNTLAQYILQIMDYGRAASSMKGSGFRMRSRP